MSARTVLFLGHMIAFDWKLLKLLTSLKVTMQTASSLSFSASAIIYVCGDLSCISIWQKVRLSKLTVHSGLSLEGFVAVFFS